MLSEKQLFDKCITVVLKSEGGYQCHPNDAGNWYKGKLVGTKYGIAAKFFGGQYDIKNLTKEQAKEIYHKYYWFPMRLYGIEDENVILHMFDMGVNSGKRNAIRMAQRIAGTIPDGVVEHFTRRAINCYDGNFLEDYKDARRGYYIRLSERKPSYKVFRKGWLKRIDKTKFV